MLFLHLLHRHVSAQNFMTTDFQKAWQITKILTEHGFKNVSVIIEKGMAIVSYENRKFRNEVATLRRVTDLIISAITDQRTLILVPQNRQIPLVAVAIPIQTYLSYVKGEISKVEINAAIRVSMNVDWLQEKMRSLRNRQTNSILELNLKTRVRGLFHSQQGVARWSVDFVPELTFVFARGSQFMVEALLPVMYQFDEKNKEVRPGRVILNHTRRFPHNYWLSASLGYFDRSRYGLALEGVKFWMNGRFYVTLKANYTGYLYFHRNVWYYSEPSQLSYFANLSYRFSRIDLLVNLGWGRFLIGDRSWKISLSRSFGEVDLGFYGLWEDASKPSRFLAGLFFKLPLPFFHKNVTKNFSIQTQKNFYWGLQPHTDTVGRLVKSENSVEIFYRNLFPTYIKNNLINP